MFDFAWSEIMLIGIIALIVIGPKDMPAALRAIGNVIKKGRKLAAEFQTHVDDMVREADLGEARQHLRELRSFDLRGQVMRALDDDGSLRRTLADNPLSPVPAAASAAVPDALEVTPPPVIRSVSHDLARGTAPGEAGAAHPARAASGSNDAGDQHEDAVPDFIPPRVARRLLRERANPPPSVLPPGALRPISDIF